MALSEADVEEAQSYDPFAALPSRFFSGVRERSGQGAVEGVLRLLFKCMDGLEKKASWRAPAAGLESALLVLWARHQQCALYEMIGFGAPLPKPSFYTVAMNEDEAELVEGAEFGMHYTSHIKVKLNGDFERGRHVLSLVRKLVEQRNPEVSYCLAIDANAAWTPAVARRFLGLLEEYAPHVYAIEQPYDVEVSNREEWKEVVAEYASKGIRVIADESMCVLEDVAALDGVATCVNLKLEKTGGIRNALRCVEEAERRGMHVWIGIMVCSVLGSSTAAQLLACSSLGGDVDGGLLVDAEHQKDIVTGGFRWGKGVQLGTVLWHRSTVGVGCDVLVGTVQH